MTMTSPIGPVRLVVREALLTAIEFAPGREGAAAPATGEDAETLAAAREQLGRYFSGHRLGFTLPLRLDDPGTLRGRVQRALAEIPFGVTVTYGELARIIGLPGGARAVGQACGRNPLPIVIPCHRVVAARGLGGYNGGTQIKAALLSLEGIPPRR